ncbi:uncharacterized protein LOC124368685 [Homalodisca vitripennis]|uniref:uncharacterized protein LOC124368685 n=1 Tax=Homalodisca vitripennis TaxID=197043 RepID=UPI001EEA2BD4|nr:uncharacterized protein LOC124368685 [Homalodisca vitripennis]
MNSDDDEVGEQSRTPDQGRSSTPEIPPSRLRRQSAGDILEAELRGEYEPEVLASQRRRAARSSIAGLPHHHHFASQVWERRWSRSSVHPYTNAFLQDAFGTSTCWYQFCIHS